MLMFAENVKSDIFLFADDTKIFREIRNILDNETLQTDLDSLQTWSDVWLLRFHPKKCKVLTIGKGTGYSYRYHMGSGNTLTYLEHVDNEKDIGVTIDEKLNFERHMNAKINKANSIMGLIRRSYVYLDEESFLLLYKPWYGHILNMQMQCGAPIRGKI